MKTILKTLSAVTIGIFSVHMHAKTISVLHPGNNKDIQPNIMNALNGASDGDVISLPAGSFILNKNVSVTRFISFQGAGIGKTVLYRDESVSDNTLSNNYYWQGMFKFDINKNVPSNIRISDITFKSKKPCVVSGDGGSLAADIGIKMINCIDFIITRCRFENFGNGAVSITHTDTLASGLISKNEFYHNAKGADGLGLGYGVVVYGASKQWIKDPKLGSKNFIFIEDNVFDYHRHAVAAGGSALYVARYNTFLNNLIGHCIDTHSAQKTNDGNYYGSRAVEVYNNIIKNTLFKDGTPIVPGVSADRLNECAVKMRAGDAIVFNNTVEGYRFAVAVSLYPDPGTSPYPYLSQVGYQSGMALGPNHSGTDPVSGDGDLFAYDNKFTPWVSSKTSSVFYNYVTSHYKEGRDYHFVKKPGYTPYTYPHPLSAGITTRVNETPENNKSGEMKIYPNPAIAGSEISIVLDEFLSDDLKIVIYDICGREIFSKLTSYDSNGYRFSLDNHSQLPSGFYLVTASANKKVYTQKLALK